MPSIINATTTNGVVTSGDNSGSLQLATNSGTTAVTIDTAQRVGIGTTSPSVNLTVNGATNPQIAVTSPAGTGAFLTIAAGGTTINTTSYDLIQDSSGVAYVYNRSNANLIFGTNNTERMRIDSSGNVGVGTTSPSTYGKLVCSGGNIGAVPAANGTGVGVFSPSNYTGYHYYANSGTAASTNWFHHLCYANNVAQFLVYGNGITQNAANSYGGISDIKLKENITVAGSQWDDVKALSKVVKKYQFINDPEKKTQLGFVAQDVQEISPGIIVHNPDIDKDGKKTGTETLGVAYSVAYMKAFKALGEALERIEKLEADIAALKGAA